MLDLKWIREHPEELRQMLSQRKSKLPIDEFFKWDAQRRKVLADLERLQAERNKSAEQIGRLKAKKADVATAHKDIESNKTQIKDLESQLAEVEPKFQDFLLRINNVPDPSVPVGTSEADNKVIREVGKKTELAF